MTKRLIVADVKVLDRGKQSQKLFEPSRIPSQCFFEFSDELQVLIKKNREIVNQYQLEEVAVRCQIPFWFIRLPNHFYHHIDSNLHVSHKYFYFSGKTKHFGEPEFATVKFDLKSFQAGQSEITPIDLYKLNKFWGVGLILIKSYETVLHCSVV